MHSTRDPSLLDDNVHQGEVEHGHTSAFGTTGVSGVGVVLGNDDAEERHGHAPQNDVLVLEHGPHRGEEKADQCVALDKRNRQWANRL